VTRGLWKDLLKMS